MSIRKAKPTSKPRKIGYCAKCGKKKFSGRKQAQTAANMQSSKYGVEIEIYRCPHCDMWHRTTSKPRKIGQEGTMEQSEAQDGTLATQNLGQPDISEWSQVKSSAVSDIRYANGRLQIRFTSGSTYEYDVDEAEYWRIKTADSIGKAIRTLPKGVRIV